VCWPSGSDLPCEMEVSPAQESGIINHSPGIRVPGVLAHRFFTTLSGGSSTGHHHPLEGRV
jgi:hypothetical protein